MSRFLIVMCEKCEQVPFFQNSAISCSGRSPVRPPLTHSMQEVVVMCEGHEWVWQLP